MLNCDRLVFYYKIDLIINTMWVYVGNYMFVLSLNLL